MAARTLAFDDLTLGDGQERPLADGYGGLAWGQAGSYDPSPGDGLGYAPSSGANLAFFAEAGGFEVDGYEGAPGDPLTIAAADGADFSLGAASFSSANVDDLPITARAYDDGVLVGEAAFEADRDGTVRVDFAAAAAGGRFASVDRVELDADRYFGFDDLAYATAETLTFDDFALGDGQERRIPDGYGGFVWRQAGVYDPAPGDGLGYEAASGPNTAFIAEAGGFEVAGYEDAAAGEPLTLARADGGAFSLEAASFSSANVDDLPITARAYDGGALVGAATFEADRDGTVRVDFGAFAGERFADVDRVELDADRYFGVDDLTYIA
jgi:hypothetical protein